MGIHQSQRPEGAQQNKGQRPFIVNGTADHIHIFAGLDPSVYVPDLMRDVKGASTYSKDQRERVINYIKNQEEHHRHQSFCKEYIKTLQDEEVSYDEKYLFDFFE